ncbi:hypothetical protein [Chryseobacterium taklimakanense]|uniref:hypothetical protein n=1 Tax=Chryseobacterium taklimakanense TaxID=536441 RepID=UPI0013DDB8F6|nr:hypothetical protein [Chryseobacterium taklimakanense]
MIKKGSKVRHSNPEIDEIKGIMSVIEIRGNYGVCGYLDFSKMDEPFVVYLLKDLILQK